MGRVRIERPKPEEGYSKNEIMTQDTAAILGLGVDATPVDAIRLLAACIPWTRIATYEKAGSYTWVAPDLFSGADYDIGVCVVGAGGSGSIGSRYGTYENCGGASGYMTQGVMKVTPGSSYAVVVGEKGHGVSSSKAAFGRNGGSSSFAGKLTASGGEGGYIGDEYPSVSLGGTIGQHRDGLYGGTNVMVTDGFSSGGGGTYSRIAVADFRAMNLFELRLMLGSGGGTTYYNGIGKGGKSPITGLGGGDSGNESSDGTPATEAGCGGGGAGVGRTSGSGADGAVYLYARRKTM